MEIIAQFLENAGYSLLLGILIVVPAFFLIYLFFKDPLYLICQELIDKRKTLLRTKNYEELSNFDGCKSEQVVIDGKKFIETIYKDQIGSQKIRIVIQIYRYIFLGMGTTYAEGFTIGEDGEIKDLKEEELYDFT